MKKILLIEDDANFAKVLKAELEGDGYHVDVVGDGVEGVLRAVDEKYDMALIDVIMPTLNGINATRILKKMDAKMPIISFSGKIAPEEISEPVNAGAVIFAQKPFSTSWMLSQIKWVMDD
ncbi:MAG: response regulator [Thermodesulfobacteriota bacterium]